MAAIETIMDHISYATNKDPLEVRIANFRSEQNSMLDLVKETLTWADYDKRKQAVEEFNSVSIKI